MQRPGKTSYSTAPGIVDALASSTVTVLVPNIGNGLAHSKAVEVRS